MLAVNDIALYFLAQTDEDEGEVISHLKLQKLCYYAQGFHLAIFDAPLFAEEIQAWAHGPVAPDLWRQYQGYGSGVIPRPEDFDDEGFNEETCDLLNEIYSVYGQFSAWKLRNMTHSEPPWRDAYAKGANTPIGHEALREYFATLLEED